MTFLVFQKHWKYITSNDIKNSLERIQYEILLRCPRCKWLFVIKYGIITVDGIIKADHLCHTKNCIFQDDVQLEGYIRIK